MQAVAETTVVAAEQLTSRATKARMGDKSMVPLMGGMMPLKRFRYGSHRVLQAKASSVYI